MLINLCSRINQPLYYGSLLEKRILECETIYISGLSTSNAFPKIISNIGQYYNRLFPERYFSQSWTFDYLQPFIIYRYVITNG